MGNALLIGGAGGGSGSTATTVSFGDDAIFSGVGIEYVDGNGNYQHTTSLATMSACSYQMLSNSLLFYVNGVDPDLAGEIAGSFTGITRVNKYNTGGRNGVYIVVYQVAAS